MAKRVKKVRRVERYLDAEIGVNWELCLLGQCLRERCYESSSEQEDQLETDGGSFADRRGASNWPVIGNSPEKMSPRRFAFFPLEIRINHTRRRSYPRDWGGGLFLLGQGDWFCRLPAW